MEYVSGVRLHEWCQAYRPTLEDRLQLFCQACHAVQYAHEHLIQHRDLKPTNILVTRDNVPKLLDFGIAKVVTRDTYATELAGLRPMTVAFASPEQLAGGATTPATDIYSLGVLLTLLVTGTLPYDITSFADITSAIYSGRIIKPSRIIAKRRRRSAPIPGLLSLDPPPDDLHTLERTLRRFDTITLRALAHDPHKRHKSARAFANAIEKERETRLPRPRTLVAAVLLTALMIYISVILTRSNDSQTDPEPLPVEEHILQPGPEDAADIYYSSFFEFDGGHFIDDEILRVGGWGDWYFSLIRFDITSLPANPSRVELALMPYNYEMEMESGHVNTPVEMEVFALKNRWDEQTGWTGELETTLIRRVPAPEYDEWYLIDITDLYSAWEDGSHPNHGVLLRPIGIANDMNTFRSSQYENEDHRPQLIATYYKPLHSLRLDAKREQYISARLLDTPLFPRNFTLELWIRPTTRTSHAALVSLGNTSLQYETSRTRTVLKLVQYEGDDMHEVSVPLVLTPDIWIHVAASYDHNHGHVRFYYGGLPLGTPQITTSSQTLTSTRITIGAKERASGKVELFFDGMIDDIRIWDGVRSPEAIFHQYLLPLSGEEEGLIGYLMLDGDLRNRTQYRIEVEAIGDPVFVPQHGVVSKLQESSGHHTRSPVVPLTSEQ